MPFFTRTYTKKRNLFPCISCIFELECSANYPSCNCECDDCGCYIICIGRICCIPYCKPCKTCNLCRPKLPQTQYMN